MSFLIQITKQHEHIFFSEKSSPTPVPYPPSTRAANINMPLANMLHDKKRKR
jgi:hypothetical protein